MPLFLHGLASHSKISSSHCLPLNLEFGERKPINSLFLRIELTSNCCETISIDSIELWLTVRTTSNYLISSNLISICEVYFIHYVLYVCLALRPVSICSRKARHMIKLLFSFTFINFQQTHKKKQILRNQFKSIRSPTLYCNDIENLSPDLRKLHRSDTGSIHNRWCSSRSWNLWKDWSFRIGHWA